MAIEKVDERKISVTCRESGPSHTIFHAVVRDGVVQSMDDVSSAGRQPNREEVQRYVLFCQEVLVAIEQSMG